MLWTNYYLFLSMLTHEEREEESIELNSLTQIAKYYLYCIIKFYMIFRRIDNHSDVLTQVRYQFNKYIVQERPFWNKINLFQRNFFKGLSLLLSTSRWFGPDVIL